MHVCPAPKLGSLPWHLLRLAFKKELVKEWGSLTGERDRVPCEFPPERPPGLCPGAPRQSVPERQLDCLVDAAEQKTNLHNGAIDHCHNMQPAVAWREYIFQRSSPG